jgi:hypothetical protein
MILEIHPPNPPAWWEPDFLADPLFLPSSSPISSGGSIGRPGIAALAADPNLLAALLPWFLISSGGTGDPARTRASDST